MKFPMKSAIRFLFRALLAFLALCPHLYAESPPTRLNLHGSSTVAQIFTAASSLVKEELGLDLKISSDGGSSGGLAAVGVGSATIGLSTKPIEAQDRATYPDKQFEEIQIGTQVLVLAVARDVWDSGIRALSKEQMLAIYEGDLRNWKQLGGPDEPIKFYKPDRGRGLWEMLVVWLYTDPRRASLGQEFGTVTRNKDASDSLEFNSGSITVLPPHFADGKAVCALGIKQKDGTVQMPTAETLAAKKYPLARPILMLAGRKIAGDTRHLVEFMLSPRGQAIVKAQDFTPVGEAEADPAPR